MITSDPRTLHQLTRAWLGHLSQSYFFSSHRSDTPRSSKAGRSVWRHDPDVLRRRLSFASVLVSVWVQGRRCSPCSCASTEQLLQRRRDAVVPAVSNDPRSGTDRNDSPVAPERRVSVSDRGCHAIPTRPRSAASCCAWPRWRCLNCVCSTIVSLSA